MSDVYAGISSYHLTGQTFLQAFQSNVRKAWLENEKLCCSSKEKFIHTVCIMEKQHLI